MVGAYCEPIKGPSEAAFRPDRGAKHFPGCPLRRWRTHSSNQPLWFHPEIEEREMRDDLRGGLRKPAVAHLGVAELPLQHAKWILDLGPHAGLGALNLLAMNAGLIGRAQW